MITDVHHHIIPKDVVDMIRKGNSKFDAEIQIRNEQEWIVHRQGYAYPLFNQFYDVETKLQDMKKAEITSLVLSPAPPMFYYWINPDDAADIAKLVNDGNAEMMGHKSQAFKGMATVPMQDPKLAIKELVRVKELYNMSSVEIGTSIEGINLDDPKFLPFFEAADAMKFTIFLHPYYVGDKNGLNKYYFTNLIGNPLDTAIGASSLIFGGILDRFKNLKILLAHGGGYFPYQIGRLDKGYQERKESRTCEKPPSAYLSRFYFDTLTFSAEPLEFLVKLAGEEHVVMGSDYPFDMGTLDPCSLVNDTNLSNETKKKIWGENASLLF